MNIEEAFAKSALARRDLEDDPNDETEQAYAVARGDFRVLVIEEMRAELDNELARYLESAAVVSEVFECITAVQKWFDIHGVKSGLPSNFLRNIKLPNPVEDAPRKFCGTGTQYRRSDILTEEGQAMFDGCYFYYEGHARVEKEAPFTHHNEAKSFNSGLGQ